MSHTRTTRKNELIQAWMDGSAQQRIRTISQVFFNREQLARDLSALPVNHRIAFAASCSERLVPNYEAFALIEEWGDPQRVRRALDEIWIFLSGSSLPEERIRELMDVCFTAAPDSEDFHSVYASLAERAASAVYSKLECCLQGGPEAAATVGILSRESIDVYLNALADPELDVHTSDPSLDEWIAQSPLMAAEIEKQQEDLADLAARMTLDLTFLEQLRQSATMIGVQPFRRMLVAKPQP